MRLINLETYTPGMNTVPTDLVYPLDHTQATKIELEEISLAIVSFYQKIAAEIGLTEFAALQGVAVFPKSIRDPRADIHLHFIRGGARVVPVLQPEQQATNLDEEKGWLIETLNDKELTIYLTIPTNNIYRQLRYLSLTECLYFFKANIIKQLQQ
ncbi:hypothetical protein CYV26_13880 [Carnobacterium maltaromaticum]|uniref:hypothetical protein n=1 Tax=Carnobacterium maltaromaticum TaxID=2751 RepID=UPI000C795158|nr:hypothetical protein [Carnobacterium maltaromaticum]PLS33144.1 hypothetical protein CYV33_13855 [Carnobacterium maltaromaticum]PLS33719.1 hypothetical protein CYV30_13665 [Carnobacterium maltaromaticum]PLS33906.1 hypothetical protein CYV31_12760 [Carnobacterium maltaromaticum]PLS41245.1 hypothetical protein CYV28_12720 [Carnobacterium maltaromaticum]PLS42300.1 hypothetical protein CYV27_13310 [Carnobacterium maltaromaticum]